MRVGIIGAEEIKFTPRGKEEALKIIREVLHHTSVLVSGRCPKGGVDIWAEDEAVKLGIETDIKEPRQHRWDAEYGFKARNIDIATDSEEVHVIVVDKYPPDYVGMRFNLCYHCKTTDHVKSGACWTGNYAKKLGKKVTTYIVRN